MQSFTVAIINYNTASHLRACLRSVREAGVECVILKDNGSTDGSVEMVRQEFPEVTVHPDRRNPGYGAASNQAIEASETPYVLLLNSDTLITSDTLPVLSRYLDGHPKAGIVGPRLHNPDGSLQPSAKTFPRPFTIRPVLKHIPRLRDRSLLTWSHDHARSVPWVKGAALAIRRQAFDDVGGFDPSFFMYFEETDLCYRLWQRGWEVHFTPDTVIVHAGGASTEQLRAEMLVRFYESMKHFYRLHYSRPRRATLDAVLAISTAFYWTRDRLRLLRARDAADAARLSANVDAWARMMRWP